MKIFALGETVYDIIFKNGNIKDARAGGSALNTSVSLGRLGIDVSFISELGNDQLGSNILRFLADNGVNTQFIEQYPGYKTAIALAFLDDSNEASYTFYKDYPAKRLSSIHPHFEEGDLVLFGSFFSVTEGVRETMMHYLMDAKENGCILIYDPNFRKAHMNELEKLKPFIQENLSMADIVRGSDQDFNLIFGTNTAEESFELLMDYGCGNLIYTTGKNDVYMMTQDNKLRIPAPVIQPVSTIGAGDNFNAGLIWTLAEQEVSKKDMEHLHIKIIEKILQNGTAFAANACMSFENYISKDFADRISGIN
ncbi:MAG: carbohydrate kinase [Bacteroidales bacterium]|nr:carbohydrate kinase [Bacteroidales bacterium]MCB9013895.1 carbohydrate kinase [Bacteroidales bacterium]